MDTTAITLCYVSPITNRVLLIGYNEYAPTPVHRFGLVNRGRALNETYCVDILLRNPPMFYLARPVPCECIPQDDDDMTVVTNGLGCFESPP
jgi:hypothetical protein